MWVNLGSVSYQLVGITTSKNKETGNYVIYGERATGKTVRLREGNKEEIQELKEALDYAIQSGYPMFDLVD